jgi:hypothetical protein
MHKQNVKLAETSKQCIISLAHVGGTILEGILLKVGFTSGWIKDFIAGAILKLPIFVAFNYFHAMLCFRKV